MKKSLYLAIYASTLLYADAPAVKPMEERTFVQSQYMPDISLIADFSFVARNKDQDELSALSIPGVTEAFFGDADEEHSHGTYNADNGFNLNYAELVMSSSVDPFLSLDAVFHFAEEGVDIEEAYFTTTALGHGIRVRGGKFLSSFGRHNTQHHHIWDFSDAPLIYQGFFGGALNEKGLQFQYTPELSEYVMLGAEVLQGENETTFGNKTQIFNVSADEVKGADAPSMFVAYAKTSFDIGETIMMPGVSYVYGDSRSYHEHEGDEEAFSGTSMVYNAELTVKHYFDSYSFLTWQSEWMRKEQEGTHYENALVNAEDQRLVQEGLYTQLVYAPDQNWRMGTRYDTVYKNEIKLVEASLPSTPYERYTAMLEYHFSEFSRLRLQYNYNNALYTETAGAYAKEDVQSLILSFNLAIGAHAAHDF